MRKHKNCRLEECKIHFFVVHNFVPQLTQEQREKLSIEFKTRMKSLERLNEDNMNEVKIKHCQEKQELTEKLRAELSEVKLVDISCDTLN